MVAGVHGGVSWKAELSLSTYKLHANSANEPKYARRGEAAWEFSWQHVVEHLAREFPFPREEHRRIRQVFWDEHGAVELHVHPTKPIGLNSAFRG